jgi:YD repeat-containing protein
VREVRENGSERPPSVRQAELLDDGTLVTLEYDQRGQVVRQSYYWSPDAELLRSILARTLNRDEC